VETRASYLLVGLFVIVGITAMLAAAMWVTGTRTDRVTILYDIYFEGSVAGLKPGNAVQYRGIPVGGVVDMRIDPENVERVLVTIEVEGGTPIKEDTEATLALQGITGVSYIQLTGGTQGSPALKPLPGQGHAVIQSRPSQLAALFDAAPELLNRAIAVIGQLEDLLSEENQQSITKTLVNVEKLTGTFADASDDIGSLVADSAAVVADVRTLSGTLSENSGNIEKILSEGADTIENVNTLTAGLADSSDDMQALLAEGAGTLKNVNELTAAMAASRGDIEKMLAEGALTMEELRKVSKRANVMMASIEGDVGGIARDTRLVLADVRKAVGRLAVASDEFATFLTENREPLSNFTETGLYEFGQFMAEARVLVGALSRLTEQIERDPARFLFGDQQQGVEVE